MDLNKIIYNHNIMINACQKPQQGVSRFEKPKSFEAPCNVFMSYVVSSSLLYPTYYQHK